MIIDSRASQAPAVSITRPVSGAVFSDDDAIEMVAETRDPDGFVHKVAFLADGRTIGVQTIPFAHRPPSGEVQTFRFVWRHAKPGSHALTTEATDNDGDAGVSDPVDIKVTGAEVTPIVSVLVRDPFAVD